MEQNVCKPVISIVIPAYNQEKYIISAIESIVNNKGVCNYDFEIIIVNDGSIDNTQELIEKFIELNQEYKISLYSQTNQGVSATRNFGLEKAQGKYVWFVDGDDAITPNALEHIKRVATNNNFDLIRMGKTVCGILYDDNSAITCYQNNPQETQFQIIDAHQYLELLSMWGMGHTGYIWKRVYLLEHQLRYPIGITQNEDICFKSQALMLAKEVYANFSYRFYLYRESISISASRGPYDYLRNDKLVTNRFLVLNQLLQFSEQYKDTLGKAKVKILNDYINTYVCNSIIASSISQPFSLTLYCIYKLKAMKLYPMKYPHGVSRFRVWVFNRFLILTWFLYKLWKTIYAPRK